jgi:hypothetical protein
MKEYARMPGKYVQAYARPQAIQSILNVESSLESVPQSVFAKGVGLWPMFLNESGRLIPSGSIPDNDLEPGPQAIAALTNRELELDSVPGTVVARGISLWAEFLNDTRRLAPKADVPTTDLVADGLTGLFEGS